MHNRVRVPPAVPEKKNPVTVAVAGFPFCINGLAAFSETKNFSEMKTFFQDCKCIAYCFAKWKMQSKSVRRVLFVPFRVHLLFEGGYRVGQPCGVLCAELSRIFKYAPGFGDDVPHHDQRA